MAQNNFQGKSTSYQYLNKSYTTCTGYLYYKKSKCIFKHFRRKVSYEWYDTSWSYEVKKKWKLHSCKVKIPFFEAFHSRKVSKSNILVNKTPQNITKCRQWERLCNSSILVVKYMCHIFYIFLLLSICVVLVFML